MKRLSSIQFLRGAAALAVVIFHICTLSKDYAGGVFFQPFLLLGNAGVDLFFVISGFVMAATTYEHFDSPGAPARFALHRLTRVYPPYWILSAPVLVYYLYNPTKVNAKHGGVDLVSSFWLTPSNLMPLIPVAWTLIHEVLFYTVFFVALWVLPRRHLARALCVWAILIAMNTLLSYSTSDYALKSLLLHPFNLEFIAGTLIGLHFKRNGLLSRNTSTALVAIGTCWLIAAALWFQFGQVDTFTIPMRVALFGPPAVMVVWGCLGFNFADDRWARPLTRMGDYSYSLYLVHILILHFGYRVLTGPFGMVLTPVSNGVLALVLLVSSIAIGKIFHRMVEQPACATALRILSNAVYYKQRSLPASRS